MSVEKMSGMKPTFNNYNRDELFYLERTDKAALKSLQQVTLALSSGLCSP